MMYAWGLDVILEQSSYSKTASPCNYPKQCMLPQVSHNSSCQIAVLNEINTNCVAFTNMSKKIDIVNGN